jgi:hypothetical protein
MKQNNAAAPSFLQLALGDGTLKKALWTGLVVGTILTAINQGDLILSGQAPPAWKVILTYIVPYCVTTWGAITGKHALRRLYDNSKKIA